MTRPSLMIVALALALCAVVVPADAQLARDNWAAAACAGRGPKCGPWMARRSRVCKSRRWMSSQPRRCRYVACVFCRTGTRRFSSPLCRKYSIYKFCFGGHVPGKKVGRGRRSPRKTHHKPAPKRLTGGRSGRRGCVFRGSGNNKVVIPMTALKLTGAWSRTNGAIVWKSGGGGGIDKAGSGVMCANIKFPAPGRYYMTSLSSAPHPTEHNDAWFRFSGGLDLYRPEAKSWRNGGSGYMKGYQNNGKKGPANYVLTIDYNGHQFITKPVDTHRVYTMCVSGRSSRYAIRTVAFIKCGGGSQCSRYNAVIKRAMRSLPPSKCY